MLFLGPKRRKWCKDPREVISEVPDKLHYIRLFPGLLHMLLVSHVMPVQLTHDQRKRLWWWAQRMSFAAVKCDAERKARGEKRILKMTRKEWAQIIYCILIRHPEDHLHGA